MSFEQDPPAVTQPTLPPPPVADAAALAAARARRKNGIMVAVGGCLAVAAVAAYGVHLSHESDAAKAAAVSMTTLTIAHAGDVTGRFEKMFAGFPADVTESVCPDDLGAPRVPLALYSAFDAKQNGVKPSAFEGSMFIGALALEGLVPTATDLDRLGKAHRVAILRTLELKEPQGSKGGAVPGRFEGTLAVFGPKSDAPICATRIVVWSSNAVLEPGIRQNMLRDDFSNRVRSAVSEAAARLHVDVDL